MLKHLFLHAMLAFSFLFSLMLVSSQEKYFPLLSLIFNSNRIRCKSDLTSQWNLSIFLSSLVSAYLNCCSHFSHMFWYWITFDFQLFKIVCILMVRSIRQGIGFFYNPQLTQHYYIVQSIISSLKNFRFHL